jgi:hypothetical protein
LPTLKLFHLIDEDDSSTRDFPLKELGKHSPDRAGQLLTRALGQLKAILLISFPGKLCEINVFFHKFEQKMGDAVAGKVELRSISNLYRQIISLISRPIYDFAKGSLATQRSIDLKMEWLVQGEHIELFNEAKLRSYASKHSPRTEPGAAKPLKAPHGESKSGEAKNRKKGKRGREEKDKGEETEEEGERAIKQKVEYADADETINPDSKGKYSKVVGKAHPLMVAWNAEWKGKKKPIACWSHFNHVDGCQFGAKCRADHGKIKRQAGDGEK